MNYEERFDQIVNFLSPYKDIWFNEILDLYPNKMEIFPKQWLETLSTLSDEQLWKLDCQSDNSMIPNTSLALLMDEISHITQVPFKDMGDIGDLPDWAFNKVKAKKRHEILTLAKVFAQIREKTPFSHLVDIGGGVGHMARIMAHYKGIECISLDINEDFQKFGAKRLAKYPKPEGAKDVKFITHDFTNDLSSKENEEIFTKDSFSLGLHTCGPLANRHMDVALKNNTKGFINFGCCYNRLKPNIDVNRSQRAIEINLPMSQYSLTLACRGHDGMDYNGFLHKKRVKFYRYALHYLMTEKLGVQEILPVGDAHHNLYWEDFSHYAKNKLDHVNLEHSFSDKELNDFYNDKNLQERLNTLFMANIIRWQMGRPLELYILLDRVLFLKDQGKSPELYQLFTSSLSPRNIAIQVTDHS